MTYGRSALILGLGLLLFLTGCKKDETIILHEDLVVGGNEPPPYDGVTTVQVSNYVNRLYIDLIGEQPTTTQLNANVSLLENYDLSDSVRTVLVDSLLNTSAYYQRQFIATSGSMLNGVGEDELNDQLLALIVVRDSYLQNGDTTIAQVVDFEIGKMVDLLNADDDLEAGTISINEYYKRFIYNSVYDEVNMGSENFVVACFENLFNRYPTAAELSSGVMMVDNQPAIVLLEDGDSKLDFILIVTSVDEFYLGLVLDTYLQLMLREPNSEEMSEESIALTNSGDLKALQRKLLISDEYAGF